MGAERLRPHLRRPAATRRAAADLLGRRRVFMAGVLVFTTASLPCGLARSPAALLAARVVQGAGAAIMTALSIISTTFTEGSERNKALGIWGALGGIGATAAWLIGGPLVDGPGWRPRKPAHELPEPDPAAAWGGDG